MFWTQNAHLWLNNIFVNFTVIKWWVSLNYSQVQSKIPDKTPTLTLQTQITHFIWNYNINTISVLFTIHTSVYLIPSSSDTGQFRFSHIVHTSSFDQNIPHATSMQHTANNKAVMYRFPPKKITIVNPYCSIQRYRNHNSGSGIQFSQEELCFYTQPTLATEKPYALSQVRAPVRTASRSLNYDAAFGFYILQLQLLNFKHFFFLFNNSFYRTV